MKIVQKISLILVALFVVTTAMPAFAQTAIISTPYVTIPSCANITTTLHIGKSGEQVTELQNFLHAKGYLSVTATGYFGPLTFKAVKAFQLASASGAVDGIVGPQTQAHIRAIDCSTITSNVAPTILNITPTSGPVGTTIKITGSGFTPTGNIVHFAVGGVGNLSALVIPSTSSGPALQQLTFTVPGSIGPYCKPNQACAMYMMLVTPNTYPISVENSNGISAPVSFTVTQ